MNKEIDKITITEDGWVHATKKEENKEIAFGDLGVDVEIIDNSNRPRVHCHCEDVSFGSYDNQVIMTSPFPQYDCLGEKKKNDSVSIDTCIATMIGWLWHQGVDTINSCCGHQKANPHVIVRDKSIKKMKELGFKQIQTKNI